MRTVVLCAALAAIAVPSTRARSIVAADRVRGAGAPVAGQPARPRDSRRHRRGPRRRAGGRPLAESAPDVRSRVRRRRHGKHDDGRAAAADHRAPRTGSSRRRRRSGRRELEPRGRRAAARARGSAAGVRAARRRAGARTRVDDGARSAARARRHPRQARSGRATPPASIGCAPSAKSSTSTRTCAAAADRARPRAGGARRASSPTPSTHRSIVAVDAAAARPRRCPPSRHSSNARSPPRRTAGAAARKSTRRDLRHSAADRRRVPEPEIVAGTKSSNVGGGDIGSVFTVQAHACRCSIAASRNARSPRPARRQADARADAFRMTLRAEIAALRAAVLERRDTAGALSRRRRRAAPAKSSASRRSATTPASAAFWSCSTPTGRARPRASARQHSILPRARRRSNSNSSAAGRFRDDDDNASPVGTASCRSSAAACAQSQPTRRKREPPSLNVTDWTEKTELYMEYPPLVAGQSALFAVHLTKLDDFQALTAGTPSLEFTPEAGGPRNSAARSAALAPGRVSRRGTPPAAGRYRWALLVDAPGVADRHELGSVTVFRDERRARSRGGETAGRRPGGDRVSEGTAVDQRVRDRAGARGRAADVDQGAGGDRTALGRRGRRVARRPRAGSWRTSLVADRRHRSCGPGARTARAAADRRRRSRDARVRSRAGAGRRSKAPGPNRRAPNDCSPIAPCRRAASRTRAARSPSPRRGCRPPKRDSPSATRRCGAAAAPPRATRSAPRANRRPRRRRARDARRVVRRRRAALQDRPDRSRRAARAGACQPTWRPRGTLHGRGVRGARPTRSASASQPSTCTTPA